jgi:O-antigen/teichoic acid export membrane protein
MLLATIAFLYLLVLFFLLDKKIESESVVGLFAGQSLAQGLFLLGFFYWHDRISHEQLHLREFVKLLKASSVVMVTNVIQLLAYRLDFWIIQSFFGNYEVGIYAQANKFANLVWLVPNILAQLLIPKFSQIPRNDVPKVFSIAFYTNFLNVAATAVCAIAFYWLYLNPAYKAGLPAFYLMLPGYFFWAAVLYFAAYFSWQGRFVYNLLCSSCCLVVIFFADILLIPSYGIEGAAVANTIAYCTVFLLYLFILKTRYSFRWKDLLLPPQKSFLKIVKFVCR